MQESFIRRVPVFTHLPSYLIEIIQAAFEERRYAAGDMVLVQGTIPAGLYILLKGQAVWLQTGLDGHVSQLGTMLVGQHIHDEALFSDKTMDTASLQAVSTTTMLVLSRKSMGKLLAKYPELQAAFGIKPSPAPMPMPKVTPARQKAAKTEAEIVNAGGFSPFVSILETPSGANIFRNHWTLWMGKVLLPAFVMLVGLGGAITTALSSNNREVAPYAWAVSGTIFLLGLLWFYAADWKWHNDFILLSETHLTLVERRPFWRGSNIEAIPLQHIQEVKLVKPSMWQQMMGFGDLEIGFFGKDEAVYLEKMAIPQIVKSEIERRQQELIRRGAVEAAKRENDALKQFRKSIGGEVGLSANTGLPYETFEEAPKPSPFGQPRPKTGEIQAPETNLPSNPALPPKTTGSRPPKFPQKRQP